MIFRGVLLERSTDGRQPYKKVSRAISTLLTNGQLMNTSFVKFVGADIAQAAPNQSINQLDMIAFTINLSIN